MKKQKYKNKILYLSLVIFMILLSSCGNDSQSQGFDFSDSVADSTFTQIDSTIYGLKMTASPTHIFIIDEGKLFAYDKASKDTLMLNQISYVDDKPYNDYDPIDSRNYLDILHSDFFQYMDGHLFFTSWYANSEGEEAVRLKSMSVDGKNINVIHEFDSFPSKILLSQGNLLFKDSKTNEMSILNLNTKEIHKLPQTDSLDNFSYLITNKETYIIGRDDLGKQDLIEIDFTDNTSRVVDGPLSGYINFGYDDLILAYDIESEDMIHGLVKKIGGELLTSFENKVLYTIDKENIYVGSFGDPQIYEVYDHSGNLKHTVESPIDFEPLRMFNFMHDSSSSGVLGIFDNKMFIMGHRNGQAEYYLVDYVNNDWQLIHTSTYIMNVNQIEE